MQYPEGKRPSRSLFLEVLEVATRIGIHRRCFLRDIPLGTISSPKALRNCLWWIHFLIKAKDQDYSQQPKTLLYSIIDVFKRVFWGLFWNSCTKIWKMYSKTFVVEFPLCKIARLQFTAYYRTTNLTTDYFFWSAQKPLQDLSLFL